MLDMVSPMIAYSKDLKNKGIYYDARDLNLFSFKSFAWLFGFNSRREAKRERTNKVTRSSLRSTLVVCGSGTIIIMIIGLFRSRKDQPTLPTVLLFSPFVKVKVP